MAITTLKKIEELLGNNFSACDSPSLRLTKYLSLEGKNKRQEIESVCKLTAISKPMPRKNIGEDVIYAELLSRLIVNQGSGILENAGLSLHRFFGYPIIPGSAVKGIAHHAAYEMWKEKYEENSDDCLTFAEKIIETFGFPTNDKVLDDYLKARCVSIEAKSGKVCFMDAIPYDAGEKPKLVVTDILTSHHSKYYSSNDVQDIAIDNEQPIPTPFPVIEKGTKFRFALVPSKHSNCDSLLFAKECLLVGLTIYGVGAKTAAGYGCFKDITEEVNASLVEKLKREEAKQKIESFELEIMGLVDRIGSDNSPTRDEFNLIVNKHNAIKDSNKDIYDRYIDLVNRVKNSLPKEDSFRSSLVEKTDKQFEGDCIKNFSKLDDSKKKTLVNFLREETGRGRELWNKLKGIQNGPLYSGIAEIRKYNKDILKQGKMPK